MIVPRCTADTKWFLFHLITGNSNLTFELTGSLLAVRPPTPRERVCTPPCEVLRSELKAFPLAPDSDPCEAVCKHGDPNVTQVLRLLELRLGRAGQ